MHRNSELVWRVRMEKHQGYLSKQNISAMLQQLMKHKEYVCCYMPKALNSFFAILIGYHDGLIH